jgi:hypothetical protein
MMITMNASSDESDPVLIEELLRGNTSPLVKELDH